MEIIEKQVEKVKEVPTDWLLWLWQKRCQW